MTTRIDLDSLDGILPLPGGDTKVAERPVAVRAPVPPAEDEGPTEAMSPVQVVAKTAAPEDVTMAVPPPSFSTPKAKQSASTPSRRKSRFVIAAAVTLSVGAAALWMLRDGQAKSSWAAVAKTAEEAQPKPQPPSPSEAKTSVDAPASDSPLARPGSAPMAERRDDTHVIAAAIEAKAVPPQNVDAAPTSKTDAPSQDVEAATKTDTQAARAQDPVPTRKAEALAPKVPAITPRDTKNAATDPGAIAQNKVAAGQKVAVAPPQKPARRDAVLNEGTMAFPAFFEHNSWKPQLEPQGIASVKQWLAGCKGTIQIIGHTSLVGRDEINDAIGLARARAVQLLLKSQIKDRRVGIQSAGSREPMDRSAGEPAQSKNRRVQLKCDS